MNTDLSEKMIAKADELSLPPQHDLRRFALEFSDAAKGFYADPQECDVKKFMGCWARARKAWCMQTGESLI